MPYVYQNMLFILLPIQLVSVVQVYSSHLNSVTHKLQLHCASQSLLSEMGL